MKIVQVADQKTKKDFLQLARRIYKDDPNWVCPLDAEIEGIFNPNQNSFFTHGRGNRWVLISDRAECIGRIAAFIDDKKARQWDQPTGGIGFFECIDNQDAANLLFDTAKNWLAEKGMEAMDGPINMGENQNHWGLLVKGFTQQAYGMQYHHPYYQKLFEEYGFQTFFRQYSWHLDLRKPFPERFWKIAERVVKRPGIECRHFRFDQKEKFINDLIEIYNSTWETFKEDSSEMNQEDLLRTIDDAKDIIEEEFIWFVYKDGEPAAFFVMFPDANQIIKHLNGKLNLFNKLKFVWLKWRKTITRTRVFVMGVKPQFQRMGLESAIFWQLRDVFDRRPHYNELELSWVGDYNPRMLRLYETVGATPAKTHITYRYLFDRNKEFKRFPIPESSLSKKSEVVKSFSSG
jgi:GNAT superfamily N-acetyltransferase